MYSFFLLMLFACVEARLTESFFLSELHLQLTYCKCKPEPSILFVRSFVSLSLTLRPGSNCCLPESLLCLVSLRRFFLSSSSSRIGQAKLYSVKRNLQENIFHFRFATLYTETGQFTKDKQSFTKAAEKDMSKW